MVASILNKTIKQVNKISGDLRPEVLDNDGLYVAIQMLVSKVSQESNVKIVYKKLESSRRFEEEIETAIYRIIQEGLNNLVNHSGAKIASIRLRQTHNTLHLALQDDGMWFNIKDSAKLGVGFADMRVRAESLGGHFSVFSSKDIGTVVKVDIPV